MTTPPPALLVAGDDPRGEAGAEAFRGLLRELGRRHPGLSVGGGFAGTSRPSLGASVDELVDQGVRRFAVVPLTSERTERAGRDTAAAALLAAVAFLPWLSGIDPALTVLRARSADQDPTPAQLTAVREQLGLEEGPFAHIGRWAAGLARGDAGVSWVSGEPVLPQVTTALAVSVTLMLGAFAVTVVVAALVCARTLRLGARRGLRR
uniref:CbiX/SirB N-terminal domain-containing protein n=1 Tax=Streptomyces scabiei TaxID=1930 RepID=UPI0023E23019